MVLASRILVVLKQVGANKAMARAVEWEHMLFVRPPDLQSQ